MYIRKKIAVTLCMALEIAASLVSGCAVQYFCHFAENGLFTDSSLLSLKKILKNIKIFLRYV